jgi:hypothetical protein
MMLENAETSSSYPLPGFGPETASEIELRIETDNTIDLDDIWPLAPSSIIVTPEGRWIAHPNSQHLDEPDPELPPDREREDDETWTRTKQAAFWEYRGAKAVAWDLSWHFIGTPVRPKGRNPESIQRSWKLRSQPGLTSPESWKMRIVVARAAAARSATSLPS